MKEEVDEFMLRATIDGQPKPNLDLTFTTEYYHSVYVSLFVRDLETFGKRHINEMIDRMRKKLGGYNFLNEHSHSQHSDNCPNPESNAFAELDAKRKIEGYKAYLEQQKLNE